MIEKSKKKEGEEKIEEDTKMRVKRK
jgi:hypothetical protein